MKDFEVNVKTPEDVKLGYETEGSCCFDFPISEDVTFKRGDFKLVETNIVIEVPKGYVLVTCPRSSTFKKYQLLQTNSIGIIDCDYCGDNDTIKFPFFYMGEEDITIEKGTRLGQGMLIRLDKVDNFIYNDTMGKKDRGGFGTTGN